MKTKLHLVHLEDSAADAELIRAELRKAGLECEVRRVETEADYRQALEEFLPDVILGDYALPSYSGPAALELKLKLCPEVPFIFVSGTIGEEAAVETLKSGAVDYVLKDRLHRIVPAIQRALAGNEGRPENLAKEGERRLARQRNALITLAASKVLAESDFEGAIRHICEIAAETLEVARASVWLHNEDRSSIVCLNLFDRSTGRHTSGAELAATQYPSYFKALEEVRIIAAEDAFADERTREFGPDYLKPLGIGAMLDAPIHSRGEAHGVLCHEHAGGPRPWTSDEKTFAVAIANFVTLAIEGHERRLAVRALAESEERFREIAENMQEVFYSLDAATGRFLYVNPAYERVWGRRSDMLSGPGPHLETIHPDDREAVQSTRARQAIGQRTVSEYRIVRPDQSLRWVRDHACPVLDPLSGKVIRVVGVIGDITEAKVAEEAMQQSLERFRMLSKATNDAIWDWDLVDDKLQWGNEALHAMFGFEPGEIGHTIEDWVALIHDEDRERILSELGQTIDAGAEQWSGEYRFRRRDGTFAHVLDRGHIIRDTAGKAVRMIGAMTDITERKESENRIAEQAALLDAASDAILLMTLGDRILFWNRGAERMFGWQGPEALGHNARELLALEAAKFDEANRAVKADGKWQGELAATAKDGRKLLTALRCSVVRDSAGAASSILAILTDITQQKALEAQFLRAQRMESIGTLASGIAHDLNNVLAPLLMSVELLKSEVGDSARPLLDTLETSSKRGADLVRQVLSFARGLEGERVVVNLPLIFKDIASIMQKTFPKNIRCEITAPPDTWDAMGDPTQLHQVFMNLCVNARDAMPQGGRISILLENVRVDEVYARLNPDAKPGSYVRASVTDTGTGVPEAIREKIFEPFFTTKEVGRGTGLGLSTTIGIVRSHGGFISLYSEPGRGAQFKVYLPAAPHGSVPQREPASKNALPAGSGELILVVDDEEGVRAIARATLERFGYRVILAANGAEAVAIYAQRSGEIAAVITDMTMPVMDGPATIVAIRALNPHVPIIASSGVATHAPGTKHSIAKPYSAATLLNTLAAALSDNPG